MSVKTKNSTFIVTLAALGAVLSIICLLVIYKFKIEQKVNNSPSTSTKTRIADIPTTYVSGTDLYDYGIKVNLPSGWNAKIKKSASYDKNSIARIDFYLYPQDFDQTKAEFWDGFPIDVYPKAQTIDEWITKYLPDFKDKLIINQQKIGNKTSYNLDLDRTKSPNREWTYRQVVLGEIYSYVIGYYNGGSTEGSNRIQSEIYPKINFK